MKLWLLPQKNPIEKPNGNGIFLQKSLDIVFNFYFALYNVL